MPFYMFQARYTPEAIGSLIKDPSDREAAARPLIEALGGTLHNMFFAMGSEDVVAIIEAPDDKAMVAGSMAVGASGAFSGGSITKLMTVGEAMEAMAIAGKVTGAYSAPTSG